MAILACLFVALVFGCIDRSFGAVQTTTTTYEYNADHALTAVTTTANGKSRTVYLTWDNCVPDAALPSSCTVSAGNGNLLGVGAMPGASDALQLAFDQRNRLASAAASGAQSVAYTYHPASLLASATLASGDALAFTYDASPLPQVTNIEQSSTSTWASYLGDTTYLSDGTEQVLCQPRKDVNGIYEPAADSFSPLRYDPYGSVDSASTDASGPATGATSYDMSESPFRYASEYTDPAWGGVYLRARWYLPQYQTFVGRDPADPVHRYGYGGGNPLGNVDPSGFSYGSISRATMNALRPLTSGKWGYVVPLVPVLGQVVGGATLLASASQLWHHGSEATWINFGFLAVSAAAEGQGAFSSLDRYFGYKGAFVVRHAIDALVGAGQTGLVEALTQKGKKVDAAAVIQSAEYSVGAIFTARDLVGIGYRPPRLSVADIEAATERGTVNLYKVQLPLGKIPMMTDPLLEALNLGVYHEGLVAVGSDAEGNGYMRLHEFAGRRELKSTWEVSNVEEIASAKKTTADKLRFEFIGQFDQGIVDTKFQQGMSLTDRAGVTRWWTRPGHYYNLIINNCQGYSDEIISALQAKQRMAAQ